MGISEDDMSKTCNEENEENSSCPYKEIKMEDTLAINWLRKNDKQLLPSDNFDVAYGRLQSTMNSPKKRPEVLEAYKDNFEDQKGNYREGQTRRTSCNLVLTRFKQ